MLKQAFQGVYCDNFPVSHVDQAWYQAKSERTGLKGLALVGHERALDEGSKHRHMGHTGYNKISQRTWQKLMILLQAPRQIVASS